MLRLILETILYMYVYSLFCSSVPDKLSVVDRVTEIAESDVYLCETKYVSDDHSLRNLSKPLKVSTAMMISPQLRLSFSV